jgi:pimeloyl-ACP methyl ester carboxylesterase
MPRATGRAFALQTDDWGERIRALAPHAFASGVDPALLAAFIEKKTGEPQPTAGYEGQIAAVLAHDSFDRLPAIPAPTLVLTGADDRVIPAASSDVLAERIPGARLEVIPGAGHLFFVEKPAETDRVLDAFLG